MLVELKSIHARVMVTQIASKGGDVKPQLETLIRVGGYLSNVAFNFHQNHPEMAVQYPFDDWRRKWDAALAEYRKAENVKKQRRAK